MNDLQGLKLLLSCTGVITLCYCPVSQDDLLYPLACMKKIHHFHLLHDKDRTSGYFP